MIVATPTHSHETYVRRALQAKKAVFCEKPVAVDMNRLRECYNLAEEVKCPLFCAFNRRFDLGMSRLRDQLKQGRVGKLYQIKTTSRDSPSPGIDYLKISNGIFHDCAVHDIDMVCWVVGERPIGVFAQGSAFDPEIGALGDVDTVAIVLKFASGVLASIDLSRHSQYGYDQRLEVNMQFKIMWCCSVKLVHFFPSSLSPPFLQRLACIFICLSGQYIRFTVTISTDRFL